MEKKQTALTKDQVIEQLNDIHTMLARLPIEQTVYQIISDKLIRIKESISEIEKPNIPNNQVR
jgi:hypothetical protein